MTAFILYQFTAFENFSSFPSCARYEPDTSSIYIEYWWWSSIPFPLRCPNKVLRDKGIKFLITYVWQPADDILSVSSMFKAPPADILVENDYRNFTTALGLSVLIPFSELPLLFRAYPFSAGTRRARHYKFYLRNRNLFFFIAAYFLACGLYSSVMQKDDVSKKHF